MSDKPREPLTKEEIDKIVKAISGIKQVKKVAVLTPDMTQEEQYIALAELRDKENDQ